MKLSAPAPVPHTSSVAAQEAPSQSVSTVDVLVARAPIAAGTVITPDMVDTQPWPAPLVLAGFIVSNSPNAHIIGKVTRSAFQAREPFISSELAAMTDSGFLAASLPTGKRAVTISTDAVSGVAGFVFPGDHVDLLFTHNVPADIRASEAGTGAPGSENAASDKPGYAEVLAANIPVLAINLRQNTAHEDTSAGGVISADSAVTSVAPSSMTLEVSDLQAEKIRLAEKIGTLSIALRSINDRNNPTIAAPADLMSLTQVSMDDNSPQPDTIKIIRGGDFNHAQEGNK